MEDPASPFPSFASGATGGSRCSLDHLVRADTTFAAPAKRAIASLAKRCKCHERCHAGRPCDGFATAKKVSLCSACLAVRDRMKLRPSGKKCRYENCRQPVTKRREALCNHHLQLKASTQTASTRCSCVRSACDHPAGQCPNPRAPKQAICSACRRDAVRTLRLGRTVEKRLAVLLEGR